MALFVACARGTSHCTICIAQSLEGFPKSNKLGVQRTPPEFCNTLLICRNSSAVLSRSGSAAPVSQGRFMQATGMLPEFVMGICHEHCSAGSGALHPSTPDSRPEIRQAQSPPQHCSNISYVVCFRGEGRGVFA